VENCQNNFLPMVLNELNAYINTDTSSILHYAAVTADSLNIRQEPLRKANRVADREAATLGAILRVYNIQNGWFKISSSESHWVSGKFTLKVMRATINTDTLNVRNGPGTNFSKIGSFRQGDEIFIFGEKDGWNKIGMEEKWVKKEFLNF